jgi:acetolactate synthase-1/2/3 large subunit
MKASDLFPLVPQRIVLYLRKALEPDDIVVLIDCPVDYAENMKLTEKFGNLVCPI